MKILMTGAGAPGGPGIYKALSNNSENSVIAADANPYASGRFIAEEFFCIPKATDDGFIEYLLDICLKHDVDVIFPLVTMELFVLSENRKLFSDNNIKLLLSDSKALSIVNDKGKILETLSEAGLDVPAFKVVDDIDSLSSSVYDMGYPNVPVVIKPCVGNGSRGIRVLDPMKDRYDLLFKEKPNSIYTDLESIISAVGSRSIPKMLVSEYLPGEEVTVDTVVDNSSLVCILIRKRDAMNNGISTSGRFFHNEEIKKTVLSILEAIPGLNGPIGFQFKKSSKGKYLLLECNPRIQGTSVSAIGCGINLPEVAVQSILGRSPSVDVNGKRIGFARFYSEVFYEY